MRNGNLWCLFSNTLSKPCPILFSSEKTRLSEKHAPELQTTINWWPAKPCQWPFSANGPLALPSSKLSSMSNHTLRCLRSPRKLKLSAMLLPPWMPLRPAWTRLLSSRRNGRPTFPFNKPPWVVKTSSKWWLTLLNSKNTATKSALLKKTKNATEEPSLSRRSGSLSCLSSPTLLSSWKSSTLMLQLSRTSAIQYALWKNPRNA